MDSVLGRDACRAAREQRKFSNLSEREWLSLQQAAAYACYSEGAFCRFVKDGTAPPSIKLSRAARRFRRAEIDSWIAAGGPSQSKKGAHNAH
jgi:predicted DNA-binding transcriptional regulator AlpA